MFRLRCFLALLVLVIITACGPDTIFVRPGLDTPDQHVYNGQQLLQRGKLDDACREFNRAMELDPKFYKAYLGLGVALGYKGDISGGMAALDQANRLALSKEDREAVQDGYRQLNDLKQRQGTAPKTQ